MTSQDLYPPHPSSGRTIVGMFLPRVFTQWPLVHAMPRRFRWANLLCMALIAATVVTGIGLSALERGLCRCPRMTGQDQVGI